MTTRYEVRLRTPIARTLLETIRTRFDRASTSGADGSLLVVESHDPLDQAALRALLTVLWDANHEVVCFEERPLDGGEGGSRQLWPAPTMLLVGSTALLLASFGLDNGGERSRDLALLIGAPTLYVLMPAGVIWLVVALGRQLRWRGHRS